MKILSFDLETTGLDADAAVTEVGAVLWHWEEDRMIRVHHQLFQIGDTPYAEKARAKTGLSPELLQEQGLESGFLASGWSGFFVMAAECDAYLGHHVWESDFPRVFQVSQRLGWPLPERPVIDTMWDLPLDRLKQDSMNLELLCSRHGWPNPFPHWALFDAIATIRVVKKYDLATVLERAKEPEIWVSVFTEKPWLDGGLSNSVAREHGFRWEPGQKQWRKRIKFSELTQYQNQCPLPVTPLVDQEGKLVLLRREWWGRT